METPLLLHLLSEFQFEIFNRMQRKMSDTEIEEFLKEYINDISFIDFESE